MVRKCIYAYCFGVLLSSTRGAPTGSMATQEIPQRRVRTFLKRPARNAQSSNESAKIIRIVREHYVRSRVHCGLSDCECTRSAAPAHIPKLLGYPLRLACGLKVKIDSTIAPCVILPDVDFVIQQVRLYCTLYSYT